MRNQLLPAELATDSLEAHLGLHARRGNAVYLAAVGLLLAALAALPLVRVGVAVRSPGIVRPSTDKHQLVARTSGILERLAAAEHQRVAKGQLLLTLRTTPLDEQSALLEARAAELHQMTRDLELLARSADPAALPPHQLRTPRFRQELAQLLDEVAATEQRERRERRELERTRALAERALVPRRELEEGEFQLQQAHAARALLLQRRASDWQATLLSLREERRELVSQRSALQEQRALHRVEAPVTGTLEQLASVSPGSYVQAGQEIGVISPLSELVAEVYVHPRDIGLLTVGGPVRITVDAFDHHQWGFVPGVVQEIAGDFVSVNQQPVFLVRVALERPHLQLKNGFRGQLKKGMTLRAHFMVAERTLWQLLRDDVDDWLDPSAG